MFKTEDELQKLVHQRPEIILAGIPEINPDFCPDTPSMLSLGRELPLSSGPIDNMFIDTNAILTFVECKLHSNPGIKRNVYSQAINYASNLQAQLMHFDGEFFWEEFFKILRQGIDAKYNNLERIIQELSKDPILENVNQREWKRQFIQRLEQNIKTGTCRIIILCAPRPDRNFAYQSVRNLMQLMTFSERLNPRYDLILMDLRAQQGQGYQDDYVTRIVWRSYSQLPQVPLVAQYSRDTSAKIEEMMTLRSSLNALQEEALKKLLEGLEERGLISSPNSLGYALKWKDTKRSSYVLLWVKEQEWIVCRHQIRPPEALFQEMCDDQAVPVLSGLNFVREEKASNDSNNPARKTYQIDIRPTYPFDPAPYISAIFTLAFR